MSIGTFESAETALAYLGKTNDEYGAYKARHQALDKHRKTMRFQCFINAEGSVSERNAIAETHPDYVKSVDDWENAMADFYILDAKRKTSELAIEIYRSQNSILKRGNI